MYWLFMPFFLRRDAEIVPQANREPWTEMNFGFFVQFRDVVHPRTTMAPDGQLGYGCRLVTVCG